MTSRRSGRMPEQGKGNQQVNCLTRIRRKFVSKLRPEDGQATAEYALVVVAAAAIALALIIWATNTDALSSLFDAVINRVRSYV